MTLASRCLCAVLAVAAVALTAPSAKAGTVLDRIMAVVNDEVILESEVNQMAVQTARVDLADADLSTPQGQQRFEAHRRKTMDALIERALILQRARELKVDVTEEELRSAVDSVRQQNNLTQEQFGEALRQQGFAGVEEYRKSLQKQLITMRIVNQEVRSKITVGDDEVRSYYALQVRQAVGDQMQVHLRQILLALSPGATPAQIDERRKIAGKVVAEARAGKDFATLAKTYGDDAASKAGGDLGFLARGDLPPELRELVVSMDPGDVRGPIQSERGLHVLQLVEKKSGEVKSFDEAKEDMRRQLYEQNTEKAVINWTKDLRRKAHVDLRY